MEKETLEKVAQLIGLNEGDQIEITKDRVYSYLYSNSELKCISDEQGYPCDYIVIGLLLEKSNNCKIIKNEIINDKTEENMSKFVYIQPLHGDETIININQISSIKKYKSNSLGYLGVMYRINLANRDVYEDISEEEFNKLKQHLTDLVEGRN